MPLIEAMAMRTPIVASNRTSIPEVVGDAGRIVDPSNIDEVIDVTSDVLTNRSLREELTDRGTLRSSRFNVGEMAARMATIYAEAAQTR
jgi:glycosyltransferase involved in cell wall biosynthesis